MKGCNIFTTVTFLIHLRFRTKTNDMKKIFLFLIVILGFLTAHAQNDTLQQYSGKYKFPEGNPVTEIIVSLDSTGLTANSALGSSELKKIEGDVFEIVAYGGTATFKRNADKKISGVQILVGDINMEGTKTEGLMMNRSSMSVTPMRR